MSTCSKGPRLRPSRRIAARWKGSLRWGRFLALTTEHADFPDSALKENVAATLQTLRDKIPLWHGQMPKDKADAILKAAFPA